LRGQRVLVTGSSGGIGAAIAVALGKRGCRVILHYCSREGGVLATKERVEAAGGTVDAIIRADFRYDEATDGVWPIVDEAWPEGLDVLINNAGVVTKCAAGDLGSVSAFEATMRVNALAPYRLACAAKERGVKKVVMMSSVHGARSVEYMSAYAASKAALDSLTATLGVEWALESGVRVVGVAPGPVVVERSRDALTSPEGRALWGPHLPLGGNYGTVDQIADATVFLLESEASRFVAGQTLTLDGGLSARANMPFRPRPGAAAVVAEEQAHKASRLFLKKEEAPPTTSPTTTLEAARDAATKASATFGASSPEAKSAWAIVEEFDRRDETPQKPITRLADECEVDDTSDRCRKLADELTELQALMKLGPDKSVIENRLRDTRERLRKLEEDWLDQ